METTVLGYPRIGGRRELKKATESWWAGRIGREELEQTAARLRRDTWETLRDAGLGTIPGNTFSWYDHVLDAAVLFGAVPERFTGLSGLEAYFAMARGTGGIAPLELTKWFDTNYHYLVPELGPDTAFRLAGDKPLREYQEARSLGIATRPVLLGPLSLLLLSKPAEPGFSSLELLDPLLDAYAELLGALHQAGAGWVQLDEPVLAADRTSQELAALERAYRQLGSLTARPAIMVATYFGEIGDALPVLAASPAEAISLDFVAGPGNREALAQAGGIGGKTLVAGVVDGRNVWRADLARALSMCASLLGLAGQLTVSTSCSLLHVPLDLRAETSLPAELTSRLAFARQKVDEVVTLGRALSEGPEATPAGSRPALPPARPSTAGSGPGWMLWASPPRARATPTGAAPRPAGCRCCPPPRSGRSPRPSRSARPAPTTRRAGSATTPTPRPCVPRSTGSSPCRKTSAWTSWSTASPSVTTWCSTSPSS